jgi:MFS family permease
VRKAVHRRGASAARKSHNAQLRRIPVDSDKHSHSPSSTDLRTQPPQALQLDALPSLYRDNSFWGLIATQFWGAFNDNLFKQILLLLFVAVPVAGEKRDLQWLATLTFSLPFILFSGFAGYLSDRSSKRRMIIACKVAEILVMALGAFFFFLYGLYQLPWWMIACLTGTMFLMGSQSAFFGPGKYGILPEMLREKDLPDANGLILMTTFVSIILGSAVAGALLRFVDHRLWIAGAVCILIAVVGTVTARWVRYVPPAQPDLKFELSALAIPSDMRQYLAADRPLLSAVAVSSVFWMAAAVVQMAVNSLGNVQLQESELWTSLMVSTISVGIAGGSVIAGAVSKHRFNTRVLKIGAWGMVVCLALLALPANNEHRHLLGYAGSIIVLVALGGFTGMFAVPLQVFMQARPPAGLKGRMIATQNLLNWVGITLSAGFYYVADRAIESLDWPRAAVFLLTALLMLSIAAFYHPQSDAHGPPPVQTAGRGPDKNQT